MPSGPDCPVERMMRDAKVIQIVEGTNEIQRVIVAREWFAACRAPDPAGPGCRTLAAGPGDGDQTQRAE